MKTRIRILALAFIGASSSGLYGATSVITYDFDSLRSNGGTILSTSCVAIFVADSDGDGNLPTASELAGITLTSGTIIGGTDLTDGDRIFSVSLTGSEFGVQNLAGSITVDYDANGVEAGNIWGLYWFPSITTLSPATTLTVGTSYGFFQSNVADEAAAELSLQPVNSMILPNGGSTINVFYYDPTVLSAEGISSTVNTPTTGQFSATFSVIPEPSALTLSGLAALALLRRRRA